MRVYAAGERQMTGVHTLAVAPAAHLGEHAGCPRSWFDADGKPRNFEITFRDGIAQVTDEIGRYLLAHKLARKTALILPPGLMV